MLKKYLNLFLKSALAGILIALAGAAFLNAPDKTIGSFIFSFGLIGVLLLEANLFTGKVGYINSKETLTNGFLILFVNLIFAFLIGLLYKTCIGSTTAMESRLAKSWYRLLFDGFGCGALIYLAVEGYKKTHSLLLVVVCVMGFILAGFEHCIADMFYFGTSEMTWQGLGDVGLVVIGNSLGSLSLRWLQIGLMKPSTI